MRWGCHKEAQRRGEAICFIVLLCSLPYQPIFQGLGDRFRLRVHLQLLVNMSHMKLYRVVADSEFLCCRGVVMSLYQELEQPVLVRSEFIVGTLRRPNITEQLDNAARHFR